MPPPVLSICIPSYNREALALELLQVLDAPGFLPFTFEVVLIDNASPDSSYDSVRGFEPRHFVFRYIRLAETISVFANVWGSLRRALGTFCTYAADDDRLIPDALAETVHAMLERPDVLATYAGFEYFDLSENRVLYPGAQLEDTIFTEETAAGPLASLVQRRVVPEIGVYRTASLHQCLLPSALNFWAFAQVAQQLRFGAVRLTSRAFYRYVWARPGDPYPRPTVSRRMTFDHWEAMSRGLDLWSRYLPAAWLGEAPPDSPFRAEKRSFLELAMAAAIASGRSLEAFDIARTLKAESDYHLDLKEDGVANLCLLATIEALYRIIETVPELRGLCIQGFDSAFRTLFESTMAGFGRGRAVSVVSVQEVPPDALKNYLMLTSLDIQRLQFLGQGCAPALVYSLEGLRRAFRL
jgi:Glycosyl transferase family 2